MEEYNENEFEYIDYSENAERQRQPKRTVFLLVLCILTMINSGFSFLSYLLMPLMKPMMETSVDIYAQFMDEKSLEMMEQQAHFMSSVADWKFILLAAAYALAIAGAILMLKVRNLGLHFYIISQLCIIGFTSFLIGGPMRMTVFGILFTLLWIGLYVWQMRLSAQGDPTEL